MSEVTVQTSEGILVGKRRGNYEKDFFFSFLGIPYAEPPVGELRFKTSIPKKPWNGVKNAKSLGAACPSNHNLFLYYVGDEKNCLNLNVFTKSLNTSSLKPVMLWVHGGAFMVGSNSDRFYGPEYLMTEDIVLVVVNYRLGVLGFLCLEDPTLGVPGNMGLKDVVLALKWVQTNIKSFGGDPGNVTIFGQSAGGAIVHLLCLSPLSKGLFHKAIVQSGCALNFWARGCANGRIIAEALHYKDTDEKIILEKLRKEPVKKLVVGQRKVPKSFYVKGLLPFGPVVEKESSEPAFLLEEPIDILKKGNFHEVPLIIGYNSEEGILFNLVLMMWRKLEAFCCLECIIPYDLHVEKGCEASIDIAQQMKNLYFGNADFTTKDLKRVFQIKTDTVFTYGIRRSLTFHKKKVPVYFYRMSVDTFLNFPKRVCTSRCLIFYQLILFGFYFCRCTPSINCYKFIKKVLPFIKIKGACHSDDLAYLFKFFLNPKLQTGSVEDISIKRFVKMWTNFAKFGNPTPTTDEIVNVKWKPVDQKNDYFLDIGKELKMGKNPELERMQFWESVYNNNLKECEIRVNKNI